MRFVVQEHHSRHLHYDFRLEMSGVLKSWAIPKGPSMSHLEKRLAIIVDDHPLEFIEYEGIVPKTHYGSGPIVIWDSGSYSLLEGNDPEEELEKGKIVISLRGKILKGAFRLLKMKYTREQNWLLIKMKDRYSQTAWHIEKALTQKKKHSLLVKKPDCLI